jgi:hypothetical protein
LPKVNPIGLGLKIKFRVIDHSWQRLEGRGYLLVVSKNGEGYGKNRSIKKPPQSDCRGFHF